MTLFFLPIQPFEERYTKQWYEMFPVEFRRRSVRHVILEGQPLSTEIVLGTFLDTNASLYYQGFQLQQIARMFHYNQVRNGDVFFVADIEFWGIESIRYLAKLNGIDVRICGFCHAGSYTTEDFFAKCKSFAYRYEVAWGGIFDKIFVGSTYHKQKLITQRDIPAHKIFVTGNPYDIQGTIAQLPKVVRKRNRVILTNRPDPEKRPWVTLDVLSRLKRDHPYWEFMVTTGRKQWGTGDLRARAMQLEREGVLSIREGLTKIEYLTLLAESKVMTGNSIEENFGYCILEAMMVDTIPIVERAYSHPQLLQYDDRCLFTSPARQVQLIEMAMKDSFSVSEYAAKYERSLPLIVDHLLNATSAPGEIE